MNILLLVTSKTSFQQQALEESSGNKLEVELDYFTENVFLVIGARRESCEVQDSRRSLAVERGEYCWREEQVEQRLKTGLQAEGFGYTWDTIRTS